ncbi:MAG: hypothetical protein R3C24_02430 [Cyanobacteriota/Melainabacteria group bacterium]
MMDNNMRKFNRVDAYSPDFADVVAGAAYCVLLATALVLAI